MNAVNTKARRPMAIVAGCAGATLLALGWAAWRFPNRIEGEVTSIPSVSIVDRRGQNIWMPLDASQERSTFVPLEKYPVSLLQMVLLSEDRRFFEHGGVDLQSVGRAFYQMARHRSIVSGASTITMQLARTIWPELRHSYFKPLQAWQAWRIESRYSKRQILEQYLNRVPFSYQVTGFGIACSYFYNKTCDSLSLAEQAALVVLPRNPAYFSSHPEALKNRSNALLAKYFESEKTESEIVQLAYREPLQFAFKTPRNFAPHFVDALLAHGHIHPGERIASTLDLELQDFVQDLMSNHYRTQPLLGDAGAALVIERKSRKILAYVGGFDYSSLNAGKVDMVQRLRSPGSTLKPFLYSKALESGYSLSIPLPDLPWSFSTQKGTHLPKNYSGQFTGPKQIRFALANSDNLPALHMADLLGDDSVLEILKRFGFSSLTRDASHYGPGIVLGDGEVNLFELVQAYATLANGGVKKPLEFIDDNKPQAELGLRPILDERIAYLITDVLSDPAARSQEFGRNGPLEFDRFVAVKTGTSSDFRDHWTVGFDNNYVVGIWRGNASGRSLNQHVPAARSTGVIFREVMDYLAANQEKLERPALPARTVAIDVCSLSGKLPGPHCKERRREIFLKESQPKETCDFHRSLDLRLCGRSGEVAYVDLPEEYRDWAKVQNMPSLEDVVGEYCNGINPLAQQKTRGPYFEEPVDKSLFAYDPGVPAEFQKLRFQVRGSDPHQYRVLRNGLVLGSPDTNGRLDWRLERGAQTFELQDGWGQVFETIHVKVL